VVADDKREFRKLLRQESKERQKAASIEDYVMVLESESPNLNLLLKERVFSKRVLLKEHRLGPHSLLVRLGDYIKIYEQRGPKLFNLFSNKVSEYIDTYLLITPQKEQNLVEIFDNHHLSSANQVSEESVQGDIIKDIPVSGNEILCRWSLSDVIEKVEDQIGQVIESHN